MFSMRNASVSPLAVRRCAGAVLAGAGLLVALPALAQPSPALDRFSFSAGVFGAETKMGAGVNTPYGRLDTGDVDTGRATMPRIQADILIGDSHGLSLDYFRLKRDYAAGFGNNFAIGPAAINTVGNLDLDFKLDFGKVAYKWWIGSGNTVLGLGAGLAYYRVGLDTNAIIGANGLVTSFSQRDSDDAIAPLLEVAVRHAINPDLRLFAEASGVRKTGSGLHGSIYNLAAGVEWFPATNVGIVLSYNVTDIDLKRGFDGGTSAARLRTKLHGPSAFLKVRF